MHLEQLSNAFGVSGAEGDVRKIILEAAKPYADEWRLDTMGNLFVTRRPRHVVAAEPLRVMVTAHMDEVGFLISEVKSDGNLKFKPIGGFDRRVLLGKALVVGPERIPGVIGIKPIHLLDSEERGKVDSIDSMVIDIGASNDTNSKVKVGDLATFATRFSYLGAASELQNDRGRVKGKALDDRAGCAVLLELLKEDYPVELVAVFTVQEEIGLRGAGVAAYTVNPNLAFVMECTAADDVPHPEDDQPEGIPRLGQGAALTVMDRSLIVDRRLVDFLIETATSQGLPYQFKRPGIGSTDAGAVHLAREGIPSAVVSIPARYIHAPAAILDLSDFWNTVKLMQAVLQRLPEKGFPHRERVD